MVAQGGDPSAAFSNASAPATASQLSTLLSYANASSNTAYVTAATLSHSGFSTVVLNGGNITFPGSVAMSGLGELDLIGPLALSGGATVNLAANYIRLLGYSQTAPTLGNGTLNMAAADQIDIEGAVSVSGASNVNLTSGGDIRLIWADGSALSTPLVTFPDPARWLDQSRAVPQRHQSQRRRQPDADRARGLCRHQYGRRAALARAWIAQHHHHRLERMAPTTPLSAGGSLLVAAPAIVQNGALYAPLGIIQLGVSASEPVPSGITLVGTAPTTASVTLGAGSLTSVSVAGLDVPYSYTINGDWQISTLPEKQVILAGANVTTQSGAVLDLSGGGDVYATEFVAGTAAAATC